MIVKISSEIYKHPQPPIVNQSRRMFSSDNEYGLAAKNTIINSFHNQLYFI